MKKNSTTHPFLESLPSEHLKTLQEVSMYAQFEPGEVIFREGEPADRFYLIHTGEVELEADRENDSLVSIQKLHAGEVLGWSWLYPPYVWHFHARATRWTTATVYDGAKLRAQCDKNPAFGYEVMKRISQLVVERLQTTRDHLFHHTPKTKDPG